MISQTEAEGEGAEMERRRGHAKKNREEGAHLLPIRHITSHQPVSFFIDFVRNLAFPLKSKLNMTRRFGVPILSQLLISMAGTRPLYLQPVVIHSQAWHSSVA